MDIVIVLLLVLIVLSVANIIICLLKRSNKISSVSNIELLDKNIRDEFYRNRLEYSSIAKDNRGELTESLLGFGNQFSENINQFSELLKDQFDIYTNKQIALNDIIRKELEFNNEGLSRELKLFDENYTVITKSLSELVRLQFSNFGDQQTVFNKQSVDRFRDIKLDIEKQLSLIRQDNNNQLTEMRKTVDEKLQKTLNERLSQSFETVQKQLEAVQLGLGEMKSLANDVGGLKRVLSNVKMRGGIGEVQLAMLLEQILAPEQYASNVKTKSGSADLVEFAIKLPGRDTCGTVVWLPIDAKFPKDIYEYLQDAYDDGNETKIEKAQKSLESTIKHMAKDIRDKYLDPPNTTDFGIMFLPFEGIYAEVVRKAALLDVLQREYKVIVTGPTTLAAILNSLQMGFRSLAIQKRSAEVWNVLGAVKKEFESFGGIMEKAQKNIQMGMNQLDDVMGKRTRAITRKLRNVEMLSDEESKNILSSDNDIIP